MGRRTTGVGSAVHSQSLGAQLHRREHGSGMGRDGLMIKAAQDDCCANWGQCSQHSPGLDTITYHPDPTSSPSTFCSGLIIACGDVARQSLPAPAQAAIHEYPIRLSTTRLSDLGRVPPIPSGPSPIPPSCTPSLQLPSHPSSPTHPYLLA